MCQMFCHHPSLGERTNGFDRPQKGCLKNIYIPSTGQQVSVPFVPVVVRGALFIWQRHKFECIIGGACVPESGYGQASLGFFFHVGSGIS